MSDGIVTNDMVPTLIRMDEALTQIMQVAKDRLAHAEERASALVHEAQQQAQLKRDAAEQHIRSATRLGYAQGREQALAQWFKDAYGRQKQTQAIYLNQRDYLAQCVVDAVRIMVEGHSTSDFFLAALQSLDAAAQKDNVVLIHVHPDDEPAAKEALMTLQDRWPKSFMIRIEINTELMPRSCQIETATEFYDASLDVLLRSLRRRLKSSDFAPTLTNVDLEHLQ